MSISSHTPVLKILYSILQKYFILFALIVSNMTQHMANLNNIQPSGHSCPHPRDGVQELL